MSDIIRNARIEPDDWSLLRLTEGEDAASVAIAAGRVIVPLAVWQARRDELLARAEAGELGVWLAGGQDPGELAADLPRLPVVAVDFPKFADGRGYSIARLLRSRHGYRGELRAIGEVLRDQFNYLTRSGFDALQPRAGRYSDEQLEAALASLDDFTMPYQASVKDPLPLFRRVTREAAPGAQS